MKIFIGHFTRDIVIILTLEDLWGFFLNKDNEIYSLFEIFMHDNYMGAYTEQGNYSDYLDSVLERWITPLFIDENLNYLALTFSNICPVKEVLYIDRGLDNVMRYINSCFDEITIEELLNNKTK